MTSVTVHTPPATTPPSSDKIVALLEMPEARARIAPLLQPGDDYERVVALIAKASRQNPEILKCDKASIVDAAATIVQWKLEVGDTAHLVPFKGKCTPVMDYKGMAQLMIASRAVRHIDPWLVYSKEKFELIAGSNPQIIHEPITKHADRGELIGVYIILHLPYGAHAWRYMSIDDVDAIRKQYSKQWKNGPCPPWYAIKTLLRQMSKLIPKSPALARAFAVIQQDEAIEVEGSEEQSVIPAGEIGSPSDHRDEMSESENEAQDDDEFQDDRGLPE